MNWNWGGATAATALLTCFLPALLFAPSLFPCCVECLRKLILKKHFHLFKSCTVSVTFRLTLLCFSIRCCFVQRFIFVLAATLEILFFFCFSQGGSCKYAMLFKRFFDPFESSYDVFKGFCHTHKCRDSHFDCWQESKVMGCAFYWRSKIIELLFWGC